VDPIITYRDGFSNRLITGQSPPLAYFPQLHQLPTRLNAVCGAAGAEFEYRAIKTATAILALCLAPLAVRFSRPAIPLWAWMKITTDCC
jgi:hypothetical protein